MDFNGVSRDYLLQSHEWNPDSSVFISTLYLALKFWITSANDVVTIHYALDKEKK